jgi:rhamnose utilization protein RhaD (predicted bifunctional aldolase and dehydrogenase)/NAD(P)-dependent dehydrogenase (short-subunit alcohol dehydrogenase family)
MKSLWSDAEAAAYVRRYAKQGVNKDVTLRVYTTQLLGGDPRLVIHGGGNTSVKTQINDITGRALDVLCVKGSGWDMGDIEPPGLPAVRLAPLQELVSLDALSDEDMVNVQRGNLLDSTSPNPSVETLLHAFLPHKFIDHTHSNAILALTDQPNGAEICRDLYGDRAALVPYIMPGFALAKKAQEVQAQHPDCEGLILLKHGVFSFGASAKEAYTRMIRLVSMAEKEIAKSKRKPLAQVRLPKKLMKASEIAPILRGLCALHDEGGELEKRFVMTFRADAKIKKYVSARELERFSQDGNVTPDHSIRIKPVPLIVPAPTASDPTGFAIGAAASMAEFRARYRAYFEINNAKSPVNKIRLDDSPRVILVPGVGLFGVGSDAKSAHVAADLAETTVDVTTNAEAVGRFKSISKYDQFEIEYWSLEQAKLSKGTEKPLARQVAVVTGAGGTIGRAIVAAFKEQGTDVALLDRDANAVSAAAAAVGGLAVTADVTDPKSVDAAFRQVTEAFGGVDILVSNAGAAWQGSMDEVDDKVLRESFELNFFAHQNVAKRAVQVMRQQGTGGVLLFNTSKQAVNPGPNFGPYGLPKAATIALMRQYAVEFGGYGIRSNAVNADRIKSGLLTDSMVKSRAKARGVSEAAYMRGNLLNREVTAEDVGQAFVNLALAEKSTGAIITVDGGNIAAALR